VTAESIPRYDLSTMSDTRTVRLRIEKLAAGGEGLAFLDGRAIFVPFALPGETVKALISEEKRDFAKAELVEVVEPSRHRIVPPCPVYGDCGGCNLQHLSYPRQVEEKALIVAEAFRRTARTDSGEVAAVPSLPFAYRNRMQFHFTPEGRIGFMRRASSTIVEAPTCPVALRPIQDWIEDRVGSSRGRDELRQYILGKDRFLVFGYGDEVWIEGEHGVVEVRVAGEPIRFHVRGFFQSNLYLLDYFIPDALAGLSGDLAADLYCGVGLFGRFLAKSFRKLVCVEQDPFALELAASNVPGGGHDFKALLLEDWIRSDAAKAHFDCVLLDPPRTGLSPEVRSWLVKKRVPAIVYVSCDPVTLARDVGELVRGGYALAGVKAFDFFPQTSHVECHARLVLA
jgi:23S rRNA (uracil1939-C5)-methyltransferase